MLLFTLPPSALTLPPSALTLPPSLLEIGLRLVISVSILALAAFITLPTLVQSVMFRPLPHNPALKQGDDAIHF